MDYNARFYSPKLGRFISADSVIPNWMNPLAFDRFGYVYNSPLNYTDPTGHGRESTDCGPDWMFCDPERVVNGRIFHYINPWMGTPPWLLSGMDLNEWLDSTGITMDELFLSGLRDPLHLGNSSDEYGDFGGCNTLMGCNYGGHAAIDAAGLSGQIIYSAGYGVVVRTGYIEEGFGNYVVIEHNVYGETYYTVYSHLDFISVNEGDIVDQNTTIGRMRNTRTGGGPIHLHFEARRSGGIDLERNPNVFPNHPFTGGNCPDNLRCGWFWPQSINDLNNYWVDLTPLLWVDYAWDFKNWQ